MLRSGEALGVCLYEWLALWCHQDDARIVLFEVIYSCENRLWHHEHSLTTTTEVIVCFAMLSRGPIA